MTEYAIRRFRPGVTADGAADAATAGWLQSAALAFLEGEQSEPHLGRVAAAYAENGWTLAGAYREHGHPEAWPVDRPVATSAAFDRMLTAGVGRQVPVHLVAGVTVRTDHRRRGLMRRLIEDDLRAAAAGGTPLAALYAMQATIYGRFGFGPATHTLRVRVDTSDGFAIEHAPAGEVDVVDRESLARLAPAVFERFHERTVGSIGRQTFTARKIAGIWGDDRPEPDPAVRGVVHYDAEGRLDGYAAYRFAGWDVVPRTIEIGDLVAAVPDAALELWRHLGAIDNVDRVVHAHAAPDDPLPWALRDRRRYAVTGGEDGLWLRILDVPRALSGRDYARDGEVVLAVTDDLGLCAGGYRLAVRGGTGEAVPTDGPADVELDVRDLASLYLGGVTARRLAAAGRIRGSAAAVGALDDLLRRETAPYCITHF